MIHQSFAVIIVSLFSLYSATAVWALSPDDANPSPQQRTQQRTQRGANGQKIFRRRVEPQWIGATNRFWYRNDLPDEGSRGAISDC